MVNGWKVTAIIFIVLFICETGIMIWAWNVGTEMIKNENECSINVCSDYRNYFYDDYEEICYCYNDDSEIVYQEYLGG